MTAVVDCSDLANGTLLTVEPLPRELWPEGTKQGYRIEYVASNFSGGKRAVGGSVFVPESGATPSPVLTWAHCTVGSNAHNAPSKVGLIPEERAHLAQWLAAGFVVAASDYEGLGTSEPHPYLDGEAIADDVIDIARAVHHMDLDVDNRTVIGGFSQGGHGSLFAAAICTAYAPELDLRGTVSLAPPVRFLEFIQPYTADGDKPVHALVPTILAGLRNRRPEFDPGIRVSPVGRDLIEAATRQSMAELDALCSATTNDEAGITGIATWQPLIDALASTSPPVTKYDRPLFLCAGGADPVFTSRQGSGYSTALAECGSDITFQDYESLDHFGLLEPAAHTATRWAADLISSTPAATPAADERADDRDIRFRILDATGDGRIGPDDFRVHALRLVQSFGRPLGDPTAIRVRTGYEQLARQLIQHYDRDGDGYVDLNEFLASDTDRTSQPIAGTVRELVSAIMELIDTGGDHRITRSRFRAVTHGLGIGESESDLLFGLTDTDGDGYLVEEELAASVVRFLTGDDPGAPGYWLFGRSE
ncbi:lipase family protein [Nocardia goodfellowii]|uniref:Esterase n=1 Tax=Nocardia goodfellowii TaxID=882446 RepID=A0ABS4Q737_9NOCA|nr:lipase family protein [Nocardia goodfellowii]MBP2187482.1 putative esterase [Nocardia goodfellowii]